MTTIGVEYFRKQMIRAREQAAIANSWLVENKLTSLSQWLSTNKYEFYDLVDLDIVNFGDNFSPISSLPEHIVSLSKLGKKYIGLIPIYQTKENGDLLWTGFEPAHAYIEDERALLSLLKSQTSKTNQERAKKYLSFCEKYHITHRLSDDCLPFEERSYLVGPFCDINNSPKINSSLPRKTVCFCSWCGDYLQNKSKFLLNDTLLCYKCCKLICSRLEKTAEDLNELSQRKAEDSKRIRDSWAKDISHALSNKPFSVKMSEFFGESYDTYKIELLQKYPEPICYKYTPVSPLVTLVDNPFLEIPVTRLKILSRDKRTCQLCGIWHMPGGSFSLEVHHIVPKARGGKDTPTNLIALCKQCHDHETWFGHSRAYKTTGEYGGFENEWEYDLFPKLLSMSKDDLLKKTELFEPEVDWVEKAKKQFLE